jgi:sulfatase maturation enzyme AslB (radical SAM superfamily)
MTVVVLPTGFCNIKCTYCFESEEMRSTPGRPNLAAVESTLDRLLAQVPAEMPVGLHGGECTMVPLKDLEALLRMITERRGESAVQTNGYQMSDALIDLFRTYNTKVSISWDGPEELNRFRGPDPSDHESGLRYTAQLARNVDRLREAGVRVSITTVLSRANASDDDKLDRLKAWMLWLHERGVTAGRFNPLFRHPVDLTMELTGGELAHAYITLFDFVVDRRLMWFPFREMIDNLLGLSLGPCVFAGCNPDDTFVYSVFPDGRVGNCDRTMSQGMTPRPEVPRRNERLEILQANHCAGCRYWPVCLPGGLCALCAHRVAPAWADAEPRADRR